MEKTSNTIKLGKRPDTFKSMDVTFTAPDGTPGTIPNCVFKYRTRKEFGEMVDRNNAAAKAADADKPADQPFTMTKHVDELNDADTRHLADSLQSWGLDIPFDKTALVQLANECPAAVRALAATYRAAVMEGNLGN